MHDLKFASRQLLKNPGFTVVAVITLALGVGANTAIFSVVNAVMLRALPYLEPGRIVMLWTDNPSLNLGFHELPPAAPDLLDWRRQARAFEQIAAFRTRPADLSDPGPFSQSLPGLGQIKVAVRIRQRLSLATPNAHHLGCLLLEGHAPE